MYPWDKVSLESSYLSIFPTGPTYFLSPAVKAQMLLLVVDHQDSYHYVYVVVINLVINWYQSDTIYNINLTLLVGK